SSILRSIGPAWGRSDPDLNLNLFLTNLLVIGLLAGAPGPRFDNLWPSIQQPPAAGADAADDRGVRTLEPGRPIKRELGGEQQHAYRLKLAADQFLKAVVEQQSIDVSVEVSGPDGARILKFEAESRLPGQEVISLAAEAAGDYRLVVLPRRKSAAAGSYEIRIEELRSATEDDRALHEARKLYLESGNLLDLEKYDQAIRACERAVEIRERVLGPDHAETADAINGLALIYLNQGNYSRAESLFQQALAIRERALGPWHPDVSGVLGNLAVLFSINGDYGRAEPLFQRALKIRETSLGPEHALVAQSSTNLGQLYRERGDDVRAEPLFLRAIEIWERVSGPEHYDLADPLNNLGQLYRDRGEYAKAEPLLERALVILEKSRGPESGITAIALDSLAELYLERGDDAKAEPLFQRALKIWERAQGPEHPILSNALDHLGIVRRNRGDYAGAKPLFQRALDIREKAWGPEHPEVARSLNQLALLEAARGAAVRAVELQARANAIDERNFALNLAGVSERQKIAYLALFSKQTDFTLSLHSQGAPHRPQALDLAFTTLLRRKGRGLDAMADAIAILRRRAAPEDQAFFDRLTDARSRLAAFVLQGSDTVDPDTYRARIKPLEEEVERREAELSARSAEFRSQERPFTLAAVQAALPEDGALVEFALYTPRRFRTGKSRPPRYLVYLLAARGRPQWVDLGPAAIIDRAIVNWRAALRDPRRADVGRLARLVDEKIMRPVRPLLRGTRHLLIAPDGPLNLIPFAALVDERNRYLVSRYTVSCLTSGRDLLRLQTARESRNRPLIIADPDFGEPDPAAGASPPEPAHQSLKGEPRERPIQESAQSAFSRFYFPPLPGTEEEGQALHTLLPEATVLTKRQATKSALLGVQSPALLHLATHGFFLRDLNLAPARGRRRQPVPDDPKRLLRQLDSTRIPVESPLLRSGLALSGANKQQEHDTGILTALEVAGLNLWGTELVVLSACDTGVGEVRNGDGVHGLRRALILAGSESQVMSLWAVSDRATRELMVSYYSRLKQGQGRGEALRQAQMAMLRDARRRHPYYWASFIQSGEWKSLGSAR
ncbi:MAG TPA: CHAT domain-containing protein, partial [Blastocatellia bacterium]|nr:CHAT domain-containing protein [Blastocatellia bacterium]